MKKTGLFYWPKQGNVETCASKVKACFNDKNIEIHTIDEISQVDIKAYDLIIVGGSTVGADVWQKADDNNHWFAFFSQFNETNMKDKPYAIFGLGDQILYPDHFVDGMKIVKEEFDKTGAKLIGRWPTEGYDFTDSDSVEDDHFLGLALDEDQQDELTDDRIEVWVHQIQEEANL